MFIEPEKSMFGKFADEMEDSGCSLYVTGDCRAPDCEQVALRTAEEPETRGDFVFSTRELLFSTIGYGKKHVRILKMSAYEYLPEAQLLDELSEMINYGITTPEEINLMYLCVVESLNKGLKFWNEKQGGIPFRSEELKRVVMTHAKKKAFSVITAMGIDYPNETSPYSSGRLLNFFDRCGNFFVHIVEAAFADVELHNFTENVVKAGAMKAISDEVH